MSSIATIDNAGQWVHKVAGFFREVFHTFLETGNVYRIAELRRTQPDPNSLLIVYEVYLDTDNTQTQIGYNAYPTGTSPKLARTHMKWNLCDVAVRAFGRSLQEALDRWVPGVVVDWMRVHIRPLSQFKYPNVGLQEAGHSVLAITLPSTMGGECYVADFTIEQFGYIDACWFLPLQAYMQNTLDGQMDVFDFGERCEFLHATGAFCEVSQDNMAWLWDICVRLDWDNMVQMNAGDRTNSVRLRT